MSHTKEDVDEEEKAFLSPSPSNDDAVWSQERNGHKAIRRLRLVVEIGMAVIIGVLLVLLAHVLNEREEVVKSPVPKCMYRLSCLNMIFSLTLNSQFRGKSISFSRIRTLSGKTCSSPKTIHCKLYTTGYLLAQVCPSTYS